MLKKFARWILKEELEDLEAIAKWEHHARLIWKDRYEQLSAQTFGEGFSPFPKDEKFAGKPL
jgi:hypothetical protein